MSVFLSCEYVQPAALGTARNLVEALFGIEMEEELKCDESEAEPTKVRKGFALICDCILQYAVTLKFTATHMCA